MLEKISTLFWFLKRPLYWGHALQLIKRKLMTDYDAPKYREKAFKWANEHVVAYHDALVKLKINGNKNVLDHSIIKEGKELAAKSAIEMGGPGDINLLFDAVRLLKPKFVIETGVAYGWSSLAILNAMSLNGNGNLYSVDMPYPKTGNDSFVGIVVPKRLRYRWTLIREPDRYGLKRAIKAAGGRINLCHYDSDKSWWGRDYAFPILWSSLESGGLFISDDIQDNMYFC